MEPNLSSVEGETLRLGIQFLYAQAGELLARRRRNRDDDAPVPPAELGVEGLQARPQQAQLDRAALERLAADIEELQGALAPYVTGEREIAADDELLGRSLEGQRRALERVLGQDYSFRGEARQALGVSLEVEDVHGYVAGLLGRPSGEARVEVRARSVGPGGTVLGADLTAAERPPAPKPEE